MQCAHCGGANPDSAAFCQYCGNPLTASGAQPLPSLTPPPPPPSGPAPGQYGAPPPRRRRSAARTVLIIFVVLVVVLLVAGVVSYLLTPAPANIVIAGINFQSPDNACGFNGAYDPNYYNTTAGSSFSISYDVSGVNVTGGGTAACTITTVTTSTPGFSISGANVPLSIPVNSTQIFTFTVNPPGSAWTGTLTVILT